MCMPAAICTIWKMCNQPQQREKHGQKNKHISDNKHAEKGNPTPRSLEMTSDHHSKRAGQEHCNDCTEQLNRSKPCLACSSSTVAHRPITNQTALRRKKRWLLSVHLCCHLESAFRTNSVRTTYVSQTG